MYHELSIQSSDAEVPRGRVCGMPGQWRLSSQRREDDVFELPMRLPGRTNRLRERRLREHLDRQQQLRGVWKLRG